VQRATGHVLAGDVLTGDVLTGDVLTGDVLTGDVLAGYMRDARMRGTAHSTSHVLRACAPRSCAPAVAKAFLVRLQEPSCHGFRVLRCVPEAFELGRVDEPSLDTLLEVILHLCQGRQGVPEELDDVPRLEPAEPFSQIPADRGGGLAEAVAEPAIRRHAIPGTNRNDVVPQSIGPLPALEIFEVRYRHGGAQARGMPVAVVAREHSARSTLPVARDDVLPCHNGSVRALLISTFDLGRQPFGLASAAAALEAAGARARCVDLAKERLEDDLVTESDLIAFFLPMHTATRLALPVIDRVRRLNPGAGLCAFGLYAPLNDALLRARGVADVLGGEFEDGLAALVQGGDGPDPRAVPAGDVPRVQFRVPVRSALLPLDRYAVVRIGDERRLAGSTEASRGCKHRCRHCPVVPVYNGRFRVVPLPIVLADVRAQVAAGARHVTFGDPDFFNGVRHAADLVRAFAAEHPGVTYDVTIKIEHLIRHAPLLPLLVETGCLFVTSAVESIDDEVLARLDKGHTAADFETAVALCREAGLVLAPTFVPFTPWTTPGGYCQLLQTIDRLGLVEHVAPIQLAIRLLVPSGSRLLEIDEVQQVIGAYSPASLTYPWRHPDAAVDALQRELERLVAHHAGSARAEAFDAIWERAHAAAGLTPPARRPLPASRPAVPHLSEPWYCCAEPAAEQWV